jgi:hypothetical protein
MGKTEGVSAIETTPTGVESMKTKKILKIKQKCTP